MVGDCFLKGGRGGQGLGLWVGGEAVCRAPNGPRGGDVNIARR